MSHPLRVVRKHLYAYTLALPALLLVSAIIVYPLIEGIRLSLFNRFWLTPEMRFIGLQNYVALMRDDRFLSSLQTTIIWVLATTSLQLLLGMGIALLLHHVRLARGFFRSTVLLAWAVPTIVAGVLWRWMYNDLYGVINYFALQLGLTSVYIPWLGTTGTALGAAIVAYCWRNVAFMVLVILAGLQSIRSELYESAAIDGASALQNFRFITIPGLKPVLMIGVLLSAIWSFKEFPMVWVMAFGGPAGATEVLGIHIYLRAFVGNEFSLGAAMATVMFVILLLSSVFYIRLHGRDAF